MLSAKNILPDRVKEKIQKSLLESAGVSPASAAELLEPGILQQIQKEEAFLMAGEIPNRFAISLSGLFRYYYPMDDGREFTKGFFPELSFLSSYSAMIQETPSRFTIQALEDSKILVFHHSDLKKLINKNNDIKNLLLHLLEQGFITKETREWEFLCLDAEQRYHNFRNRYPGLESRIKQHMVASYLGINPVTLSRIRKKLGLVNID